MKARVVEFTNHRHGKTLYWINAEAWSSRLPIIAKQVKRVRLRIAELRDNDGKTLYCIEMRHRLRWRLTHCKTKGGDIYPNIYPTRPQLLAVVFAGDVFLGGMYGGSGLPWENNESD